MLEVNGLENLVSEFSEGNTGFQTAGYDFLGQHLVDVEHFAVIAQEVQQGQLGQPVIVVYEGNIVFAAEQTGQLSGQAFYVMLYLCLLYTSRCV